MADTIVTRIYALRDERDGKYFYVGRTKTSLKWRLRGHLKDARSSKNPKARKISLMVQQGYSPQIVEIETLINASLSLAEEKEQAWIDFLSITCSLTNVKPASAGGIGFHTNQRYDWTTEIVSLLGTRTDSDIARAFNYSENAVKDKRQSLGIPKFHLLKWTKENLQLLGKMPDCVLAKKMGCSSDPVCKKRRQLNIPQYQRCEVFWTEDKIAQLGMVSDIDLAEKFGCSVVSVGYRRRLLKIPAYIGSKRPPVRPRCLPTTLPDWVINLLGEMSDRELSEKSGYSHRIIWGARDRRNIPSFDESIGHPSRFGNGRVGGRRKCL